MINTSEQRYTIRAASDYLQLPIEQIRDAYNAGQLPGAKDGGVILFTQTALDDFTSKGDAPPREGEESEPTFDLQGAAAWLEVQPKHLYSLVSKKRLPDRRGENNGAWLWYLSDLQRYRNPDACKQDSGTSAPDPEPLVDEAAGQERAVLDEAERTLTATMVSRVLASVQGGAQGVKWQETRPTIRVWEVDVQTAQGMQLYQVVWDLVDFRLKRME